MSTDSTTYAQDVVVRRIELPFWHVVGLLIKLSLAAIPATIILAIVYVVVVVGIIGGIAGSLHFGTHY